MTLINGDAIEQMTKLKRDSVDLLFADLPYGCLDSKWDIELDLVEFWKQAHRIVKREGAMIFTATIKFAHKLIETNPKNFKYDLVWSKSNKTGHLTAKTQPMRQHELILVFYRKAGAYNLDTHNRTETGKMRPPTKMTDTSAYKFKTGKWEKVIYNPPLPTSMLYFPRDKNIIHTTQKPLSLMEWIVSHYSREGQTVLDPTCGSGTTCVACVNLNRNYIGIEKDTTIYESARQRITAVS